MPCRKEIKRNLESLIKSRTKEALGKSPKIASAIVKKTNKEFGYQVVSFSLNGDYMDRYITIPQDLIDTYYDNELRIEELQEAENVQQVDAERVGVDYNSDYLFEPEEGHRNKIDNYISFKENLLSQLRNRLNNIRNKKQKSKSNPDKTKALNKLEKDINLKIEGDESLGIIGLEQEIEELKAAGETFNISLYAQRDLERLDKISKSNNVDNLKEARKIIDFYKELGDFSNPNKEHPLFFKDEIYEDGELLLDDLVIGDLIHWRSQAETYEAIIADQEARVIEQTINSNRKVKLLSKQPLNYSQIISEKGGLKDTNWVDKMVMDITNGIFSHNGIMPQVMQNTLEDIWESKTVWSKGIAAQVNIITPEVEKELKNMGQSLPSIGILGVNGVSYNIFKQKYANGQETGRLIHRYKPEFWDVKNKVDSNFYKEFKNALKQPDAGVKRESIAKAHRDRRLWYDNNMEFFNVNSSPEIITDSKYTKFLNSPVDEAQSQKFKTNFIANFGEQMYKELLQEQQEQLDNFISQYQVYEEDFLEDKNVTSVDQLSEADKSKLKFYEKLNSPFHVISPDKGITPNLKYTITFPKVNSSFYDESFSEIESNETLLEFYNTTKEVFDTMRKTMPASMQDKLSVNTIPALKKSIMEILMDKNTSIFKSLSIAAKELYERLKLSFGINRQDVFNYAEINPVTGKPEYKVNDQFFRTNKRKIDRLFNIRTLQFRNLYNQFQTEKNQLDSIKKGTFINTQTLDQKTRQIITDYLNIEVGKLPNRVDIGTAIHRAVTHNIVQENSFDLPKILKFYSELTMEYAARTEAMPLLEVMKRHYEQIEAPDEQNTGEAIINAITSNTQFEGLRTNAIQQINNWFERSVLGNYGEQHSGLVKRLKKVVPKTKEEKINSFSATISTINSFKIKSREEKILEEELDKLIDEAKTPEEKERLEKIKEKLGKDFAMSAVFNNLLNFIRFKGLGYNLSSSITNYLEGQSANMIVASSGDFFTPSHIYKAMDITKGAFLHTITLGKVRTKQSKKARVLMDRYRVLQDASNELQKASTKSAISGIQKFEPYEIVRRVEYMNQTPLMISILMDTKIEGKEGQTSNVWDAFTPEGTLKEEFATEENVANWENADGEQYRDFKSHVNKTIVTAHGDYDQLRGNVASTSIPGKALLMFKRWMARQFYQRFAVEQDDIELGIKGFKGRYRSHTASSGSVHGGLIGLTFGGPAGFLIGFGLGGALGGAFGADSNMTYLQGLLFTTKALTKKALGMPINYFAGRELLSDNTETEGLITKEFTERDAANLKANITDMALLLSWIGLTLFAKAMFWDDDEADSARRQKHNLLANRFLQLSSQATMYLNLAETHRNTVGSVAVVKFYNDVTKTTKEFSDFLEGDDILAGGSNSGESALRNQLGRTFLPSPLKSGFGFETQMQRQFTPSPYDKWFWDEEKKAKRKIQGKRAKLKKKLEKQGKTEKKIKKILDQKYPL